MKQITKDQHFVPRFYLKQFAKEGQIQIFDVQAKRIGKPRPYGSVCYEKFFYAAETGVQDELSQILELMFGRIESAIANPLPEIIKRAVGRKLISSDLDVLANFMSVQWIRTPHCRKRVQTIAVEAMKKILKKLASSGALRSAPQDMGMSDEGIERLEQNILSDRRNLRIPTNAFSLLSFKDIPEFSGRLLAKKWRIVLSEEPYRFITSDNPVAEWGGDA